MTWDKKAALEGFIGRAYVTSLYLVLECMISRVCIQAIKCTETRDEMMVLRILHFLTCRAMPVLLLLRCL